MLSLLKSHKISAVNNFICSQVNTKNHTTHSTNAIFPIKRRHYALCFGPFIVFIIFTPHLTRLRAHERNKLFSRSSERCASLNRCYPRFASIFGLWFLLLWCFYGEGCVRCRPHHRTIDSTERKSVYYIVHVRAYIMCLFPFASSSLFQTRSRSRTQRRRRRAERLGAVWW